MSRWMIPASWTAARPRQSCLAIWRPGASATAPRRSRSSRSVVPGTYSIVRKRSPSASPRSCVRTTFAVGDLPREADLLLQRLDGLRPFGEASGGQDLQRDLLVQLAVEELVDRAHPAPAEDGEARRTAPRRACRPAARASGPAPRPSRRGTRGRESVRRRASRRRACGSRRAAARARRFSLSSPTSASKARASSAHLAAPARRELHVEVAVADGDRRRPRAAGAAARSGRPRRKLNGHRDEEDAERRRGGASRGSSGTRPSPPRASARRRPRRAPRPMPRGAGPPSTTAPLARDHDVERADAAGPRGRAVGRRPGAPSAPGRACRRRSWSVARRISSAGASPLLPPFATNATWPPVRSASACARASSSGIDGRDDADEPRLALPGSPAMTGAAATTARLRLLADRRGGLLPGIERVGHPVDRRGRTGVPLDRGPVAPVEEDAALGRRRRTSRVELPGLRLVRRRVRRVFRSASPEDRLDSRLVGHRAERRLQLRLEAVR